MVGLAILIVNPILTRAESMTDNQKYLSEAEAHEQEFEVELEPERLREAYMALEGVNLREGYDPTIHRQLRAKCLSVWLNLVQLLDRYLDPNFDPRDVPEKIVEPPPVQGGVVLRPGADPALIADPKARAEYKKAIATNREKAIRFRLQINLHRLNERIPPRVEAFIRNSFSPTPDDQAELRTAIDKLIKNPRRKVELLKLLAPPHVEQ
jgi:hypothetical protein